MVFTMKPWTVALIAATVVTLTGCTPAPSRADVAERFAIEMAASIGDTSDWLALGDEFAESALDGMCGEDTFRSVAFDGQDSARAAWDATCLMYFEGDMTAGQIDRAKASILDRTLTD